MLSSEQQKEIVENLFKTPAEDACWNCSEYVLHSVSPFFNVPLAHRRILQKTATAFGHGLGDSTGPCGLLTGLFLIAGYLKGRLDAADSDSKVLCYELGKELKENIIALKHEIPEELVKAGGFWSLPDQRMECRRIRILQEEYAGIEAGDTYCRAFLKMALQAFNPIAQKLL